MEHVENQTFFETFIYILTKFYQERSGKKFKSVKFFNLLLNQLRFCGFAPTLKKVVLN